MTRAPAVSVVLPVYNAEATLARAIASLQAQTDPDFELIAVDDGSTDGSAAILRGLAEADPRIRVLTRSHEGIVAALNAGLAAARAPYVARMDADDESHPSRLAAQRAMLDADPGLGVASCLVAHPAPEAAAGYAHHVAWLNRVVTAEDVERERFVEAPLAHPSAMFRRELVARHGGYRDGDFPEDYELWLRWLEAGVRMAKAQEVLLTWHDPPGRLSRTHPRYDVEAFYRLKAGYLARWLAAHNPHHPAITVWGSGKTSRRRAALLEAHGVRIRGYIDVDPARRVSGSLPITHYLDVTDPRRGFIVAYVSRRDAHEVIRGQLLAHGFVEGRDFIFAA